MTAPGLTAAEKSLRQRVNSSRGQDRGALYELIRACAARGEMREAFKLSLQLCAITPEHPTLWLDASQFALGAGLLPDALKAAKNGLKGGSEPLATYRLLAECNERLGRVEDAIVAYRNALVLAPNDSVLLNNLGLLLRRSGRLTEARCAFEQARVDGHTLALLNNLANTYRDLGLLELSLECYDQALQLAPGNLEIHFNLGLLFAQINRVSDAINEFATIVAREPTHFAARLEWCDAVISQGSFNEALSALREIVDKNPTNGRAWLLLSQILSPNLDERGAVVARIQALIHTTPLPVSEASLIHFALGKLLDDGGAYAQAFQAHTTANQLTAKSIPRARRQYWRHLANEICARPKEDWQALTTYKPDYEIEPIFVIGMPRSGTTLVEQILARGGQVQSAGEIDFFGPALARFSAEQVTAGRPAEIWRQLNTQDLVRLAEGYRTRLRLLNISANLFSDKSPLNFLYIGVLHALFPHAKWVHCTRHPLDTCLSIYFQRFAGLDFAYSLDDIADFYIAYRNCLAYWRQVAPFQMVEIRYEELVAAPEVQTRRLFEGIGLTERKVRASELARTAGSVSTMSRWQVRQDIYTSSTERWTHYQKELAPLKKRLAEYLA